MNTNGTMIEIKHYHFKIILIKLDHHKHHNLKKSETQKIQLIMAINFMYYIGNYVERLMHSRKDSKEIMINDEAHEVIKSLFD